MIVVKGFVIRAVSRNNCTTW